MDGNSPMMVRGGCESFRLVTIDGISAILLASCFHEQVRRVKYGPSPLDGQPAYRAEDEFVPSG